MSNSNDTTQVSSLTSTIPILEVETMADGLDSPVMSGPHTSDNEPADATSEQYAAQQTADMHTEHDHTGASDVELGDQQTMEPVFELQRHSITTDEVDVNNVENDDETKLEPECFDLFTIITIGFGEDDSRLIAVHEARLGKHCQWLRTAITKRWGGKRIIDASIVSYEEMSVYVEWLYGPGDMKQLKRDQLSWMPAEIVSLMHFALVMVDDSFLAALRDFFRTLQIDKIVTMEPAAIESLYRINDQELQGYVTDMFLSYGKEYDTGDLVQHLPNCLKNDLIAEAFSRTSITGYGDDENNAGW